MCPCHSRSVGLCWLRPEANAGPQSGLSEGLKNGAFCLFETGVRGRFWRCHSRSACGIARWTVFPESVIGILSQGYRIGREFEPHGVGLVTITFRLGGIEVKNLTKLPRRVVIGMAVMLVALGGAAVFSTGPRAAVAQGGTTGPYWINLLHPNCDVRCYIYWPEYGCWCFQLPPIIVEVPND